MDSFGISPVPPLLALSARLESARGLARNEYRSRVKREVRDLCDTGFDALRVALYEFEAARGEDHPAPAFEQMLGAPLAASFLQTQRGVRS
jgi:hypothetical protein